ncbi:MAG: glycosyltransferase [Prochlorotrichaceae cyanobacterium]|jgi:glycosyltransferase involved in cell wall biosynthesis
MEHLRVAIVHDRIQGYGNEERILAALHEIYPTAPIYLGWMDPHLQKTLGLVNPFSRAANPAPKSRSFSLARYDPYKRHDSYSGLPFQGLNFLKTVPLHFTAAQRFPRIQRHASAYRFLLPYVWEALDFSGYDLVISSSFTGFSHAIRTHPGTLHLCYCHSPSRSLWETSGNFGLDLPLRQYDFYAAQRVDRFLTHSERVAKRIRHFYRRSADVIAPPVTVAGKGHAGERYYLYVGNLSRSLQVDALIQAFNQLQRPLQLVGSGSDEANLRSMAGNTISFLGSMAEVDLESVYANATAFVFPAFDADFAVEPVQAMGRGLPVIAYKGAGMGEVVLHYRTGLLFEDPSLDSLAAAIVEFERLRFFSQACIDRALEFAPTEFAAKIEWFVAQAWDEFCQKRSVSSFS